MIRLNVVDNGCTFWSKPITLNYRSCPCDFTINSNSNSCLGVDANGNVTEAFTISLTLNNSQNGTFAIVPNGPGSLNASITGIGTPAVTLSGILSYTNNGQSSYSFKIIYTDPNGVESCEQEILILPTGCGFTPCSGLEFSVSNVQCQGLDSDGSQIYSLDVAIPPYPNALSLSGSVSGGQFIVPTSVFNPGTSAGIFTGYYIDTPPDDQNYICTQVDFFDPANFTFCSYQFCFDTPVCPGEISEKNGLPLIESNNLKIAIAPNPTAGKFTLNYFGLESDGQLTLKNPLGQILFQIPVTAESSIGKIDLNPDFLQNGLYFVELNTVKGQHDVKRVLINR